MKKLIEFYRKASKLYYEFYRKASKLYYKVFGRLLTLIMLCVGIYGLYDLYVLGNSENYYWTGMPFVAIAMGILGLYNWIVKPYGIDS